MGPITRWSKARAAPPSTGTHDLGPRAYDFHAQTPVILAGNQKIADQILALLHMDNIENCS